MQHGGAQIPLHWHKGASSLTFGRGGGAGALGAALAPPGLLVAAPATPAIVMPAIRRAESAAFVDPLAAASSAALAAFAASSAARRAASSSAAFRAASLQNQLRAGVRCRQNVQLHTPAFAG